MAQYVEQALVIKNKLKLGMSFQQIKCKAVQYFLSGDL